jgi:2,3-bisphosphoglycerate-independent phosphoglycerate mutase
MGRKYIFLVGDGMADYPLHELGGRTPLQVAETSHLDLIASVRIGLVRTIPANMEPGSDVANLSLLGYDPRIYHTRRGPFEAASMGIKLKPDDVAFRMNLVTLERRSGQEMIMISHSSGDIPAQEAGELVEDLKKVIEGPDISVYQGVGYRHLLVWANGPEQALTIPPHDVLGQNMATYLDHTRDNPVPALIRRSWEVLTNHSVNLARRHDGLPEANSIWLWGQGKAPRLAPFLEKYGITGAVISAVDLIKGIGVCAGLSPIYVEGATGYLNTNYLGKAYAALRGLKDFDFVFLHVEAPDEAGHSGNYKEKIEAIENFDHKVVGPVLEGLREHSDYRVMVVSDHLTPIVKRTHTDEPTPFAWASKEEIENRHDGPGYSEASAQESGILIDEGHELMDAFISER